MRKKIAIEIDHLLRNWIEALISVYKKQIDDSANPIIKDINNVYLSFPFPMYTEVAGETPDMDISENILILDESKLYEPNQKFFNKFLFDNVLEIFGHAKEPEPNSILFLNEFIHNNKNYDITLFSKANGKAIPATLFFLSKCGAECTGIKFIKSYSELNEYDFVVISENTNDSVVEEVNKNIICLKNIKQIELINL